MKFEQDPERDNVLIIGEPETYEPKPIPEIGKTYIGYDDGKIRFSRLGVFTVEKVLSLDKGEVPQEDIDLIAKEIEECYWLFYDEQDEVVYTRMNFAKDAKDDNGQIFIRTKSGGWFGLGWFASRLDIDGSITRSMLADMRQYGDCKDPLKAAKADFPKDIYRVIKKVAEGAACL